MSTSTNPISIGWRNSLIAMSLFLLTVTFVVSGRAEEVDGSPHDVQSMRFLDRGEFVEDKQTGLLWQKDGAESGKMNYYEAARYAQKLELGGITGWRVPTPEELAAVFPAVARPFKNSNYTKEKCCAGPSEFRSHWTCEIDDRLPDYAYVYHWYAKGGKNNCYASKNFVYVRCVHDPISGGN